MGMDYERKSCRLDRRRSERGSNKSKRGRKSRKKLQKIKRNKDLRLRTLQRRLWQDDKAVRNYRTPTSEWHGVERSEWVERIQWDAYFYSNYNDTYRVLVVNKFVAKDFYGNMLPRWDIDSHQDLFIPVHDFIPDDDDIRKIYSIPDFGIQFYFPEDGLWFNHYILKTIAEYIPDFGFQCFHRSRESMKGGVISHEYDDPSIFHFAGNFKRTRTFVYKFPTDPGWRVRCLGNHETREPVPFLKKRHFHMDVMHGKMTIENANLLFRFDIGSDDRIDRKGDLTVRDVNWFSVAAFITGANLVLVVFSSEKQQFYSMGDQEQWCWLGDSEFIYYPQGNIQEVYGYDLDVFLKLFLKADNLYDLRFQKYCIFTRDKPPPY